MPKIQFQALIKKVESKALASLDKGFSFTAYGEDEGMKKLMDAPADNTVTITVEWQ
jgi:hypothetical protein